MVKARFHAFMGKLHGALIIRGKAGPTAGTVTLPHVICQPYISICFSPAVAASEVATVRDAAKLKALLVEYNVLKAECEVELIVPVETAVLGSPVANAAPSPACCVWLCSGSFSSRCSCGWSRCRRRQSTPCGCAFDGRGSFARGSREQAVSDRCDAGQLQRWPRMPGECFHTCSFSGQHGSVKARYDAPHAPLQSRLLARGCPQRAAACFRRVKTLPLLLTSASSFLLSLSTACRCSPLLNDAALRFVVVHCSPRCPNTSMR